MSALLIDAGNSSLKYAFYANQQLGLVERLPYHKQSPAEILKDFDNLDSINAVYVANVAGAKLETQIREYFQNYKGISPQFAKSQKNFNGLDNAYINETQLGVDRWLAAVYVSRCFKKPFCVADCGSAVTIDAVDSNSKHLGGLILPGVSLMQSTLNAQTDAINIGQLVEPENMFGKNTQEAVSAGIYYSIAAVIDKACKSLQQATGDEVLCVLSGGDAARLQQYLTVPSTMELNLVLKGLAIYFGLD